MFRGLLLSIERSTGRGRRPRNLRHTNQHQTLSGETLVNRSWYKLRYRRRSTLSDARWLSDVLRRLTDDNTFLKHQEPRRGSSEIEQRWNIYLAKRIGEDRVPQLKHSMALVFDRPPLAAPNMWSPGFRIALAPSPPLGSRRALLLVWRLQPSRNAPACQSPNKIHYSRCAAAPLVLAHQCASTLTLVRGAPEFTTCALYRCLN